MKHKQVMGAAVAAAGLLPGISNTGQAAEFKLEEASIAQIEAAMQAGALTSVELVAMYLNRIAVYDQNGLFLNSTPVINPDVFKEAAAADRSRKLGKVLGPVHGIPFSVKDTFNVAGLPTASGSPAFLGLMPEKDATLVARMRKKGGVVLGKTNLPPMGNGTNNRSVYGTSKNPYNVDASPEGSSYGSGIAAAANLTTIGFGGDTTGSLRFPASAQSIVTLKPSKALLPGTGTSPLGPHNDVVGPMVRTLTDLALLYDILVEDFPAEAANLEPLFYEAPSTYKPSSYSALLQTNALAGKRIGVPKPYISQDFTGTTNYKTNPRVQELFDQALAALTKLGATVVPVDWPAFHTFARDNEAGLNNDRRSISPTVLAYYEGPSGGPTLNDRMRAYYYDEFIKSFHNPLLWSFGAAGDLIHYDSNATWLLRRQQVRDGIMLAPWATFDGKPYGQGLVEGFDAWAARDVGGVFSANALDVVVYPVVSSVAPLVGNETAAEFPRRYNFGSESSALGLPSMVVPMGYLAETKAPLGLTFLGPARKTDADLFAYSYAYEQATKHRKPPELTPPLPGETISYTARVKRPREIAAPVVTVKPTVRVQGTGAAKSIVINGLAIDGSALKSVSVYVNGRKVSSTRARSWKAKARVSSLASWVDPGDSTVNVIVVAKDVHGNAAGAQATLQLPTGAL